MMECTTTSSLWACTFSPPFRRDIDSLAACHYLHLPGKILSGVGLEGREAGKVPPMLLSHMPALPGFSHQTSPAYLNNSFFSVPVGA